LHYVLLALLGLLVGTFGTLVGAGGGFIHVPLMAGALGFPTHIASATSHFVLFTGPTIRKFLGVALLVLAIRLVISALG
jgi:uncharacterized protein